jgi:hypothetical protein
MPDKDKPLRPKLIVPGAGRGEKKGRPVVATGAESSKQQVLVPQSEPSPEARDVVPGLPEEVERQLTVPLSGLPAAQPDVGLPAGTKAVVRPMLSPASVALVEDEQRPQVEDSLPEVVEMGPAPEEDDIVDIVGTIGVAEEVIAELDEVAQREEQARIAEAERVRIAEEERAMAEAQARAEEEERVRAETQAQAVRQQQAEGQAPLGRVQAQQGYPMSPGQPYPGQAYGAAGEGRHGVPAMQVKQASGIPGWAIYMIGFLSGALILLVLFMATPMGEGLISKSLMEKGWRKMENPGKSRRSGSGAVQATTFSQPGSVE